MHTTKLICLLLLTSFAYAQDQEAVQKTVRDFFEVFSSRNLAALSEVSTEDILIVEDGELWNRDSIAKFIGKPAPQDFRRENSMRFLETNIRGQMAWTTYENTARNTANQRKFLVVWLETAVLLNEGKRWKIRTLHSTSKENRRQ